jgi:hypothetical protein
MVTDKCMNVIEKCLYVIKNMKNKQKEWHPATKPLIISYVNYYVLDRCEQGVLGTP